MPLDLWSSVIAVVLSTFGFLVFLLLNKKVEIGLIEKQIEPASKEAQNVLIKNFLSFGEIPTKSKLISIMTSLARKYHVQLLSHMPIQNVIDNLIYYVISNDLLDPYKKKEISDKLIKLKTEPISSEDYLQMVADNEEAYTWRQKFIYSQLTKVLIYSSLFIISLGVFVTQFQSLPPQITFLINWVLVSTISFSLLVAGYTVVTILSHLSSSHRAEKQDASKLPMLGQSNYTLGSGSNNALSNPAQNNKKLMSGKFGNSSQQQPLATQKNSMHRNKQQAERMMSIDTVTNLNEAPAPSKPLKTNKKSKEDSSTEPCTNEATSNDSQETPAGSFETI